MTLEELRNNEALAEEIFKAEDLDDLVSRLRANGVEFDEAELRTVITAESDDGELNETALEGVAGGVKLKDVVKWLRDMLRKNPHFRPNPLPFRPFIR